MNDSSCSKMFMLKFLIYISSRHDVEIRPHENFHQHFGSTNESRGLSGNCCFWYNSQTYQSARKNDGRQQGSNSHLKQFISDVIQLAELIYWVMFLGNDSGECVNNWDWRRHQFGGRTVSCSGSIYSHSNWNPKESVRRAYINYSLTFYP